MFNEGLGKVFYKKNAVAEPENWQIGAQGAVRKVPMHPIQIYRKKWKLGHSN